MARRPTRQMNTRYVSGNLAYDNDYLEREQRRRVEREQREYAARRAREATPRPAPRRQVVAPPKHRERIRVSMVVVFGFAIAAAMTVVLLMNYAQLTAISGEVVSQQKELTALQEEHVKLVARYERTFDLAAIKEAAEAAGMAKPSASQICYVDLSAPDNVVIYEQAASNVLSRVATAVGRDAVSIVEYFK